MSEILNSFSGVLVNTLTVLVGSSVGLLLKKGIPEKISGSIMKVIGLCVLVIGISGALKGENQLVMILSLIVGTVIGILLKIDDFMNKLGDKVASLRKKDGDKSNVSQAFVTASLLFCIGAMTIVGSINAGVSGDNQMIYTKSVLDLISSMMLAASMGVGVLLSAGFVFVFQGALVALAMGLGSFLSDATVNELICTGSVMIIAIGLNLAGITKFKVANMLPAVLLVPFFCWALGFLPLS